MYIDFLTKHFKHKTLLLAGCLAISSFGHTAFARSEVPNADLAEIIVTGVAEPSSVKSVPATVQVISREEIDRTGTTTLAGVLERVLPGTFQPQQGGKISVGMRGFRNDSSLGSTWGDGITTLLDGNRTNIGNINLFPLGNIERIEIVRGPSSVIYGASALGGVINIITKRGTGKLKGAVGAEYGSFGTWKGTASVSGGIKSDMFGYAFAGQRSHTGDYEDGDGDTRVNSHVNNGTISAIGTYRPDEATSMSLVFNHSSFFNLGSPGQIGWETPKDAIDISATYGALDFSRTLDNDVYINAAAYATATDYTITGSYFGDVKSSQVGARALVGIPIMDFGRIAIGGEYSHTADENEPAYNPDGEYDVFGLFSEYKVDIGPVALQTGLRYDNFTASTQGNSSLAVHTGSQTFDKISWQAGATYWMFDWLGVRVSTGTSFTPPAPFELAGDYSSWGTRFRGNPDLDPESAWSSEIGIEVDYAPFSASIAYFSTDLDDRIVTEYLSFTDATYANAGKERIAGFEALLKIDYTWAANDTLNIQFVPYINAEYFTKRENRENDTYVLAKIPEYNITYGLGLGFDYPMPIWFDINARTTGSQNIGFPQGEIMDSFTVVNLRLTVDPIEDLSVYFSVDNLADREYAYVDGYPMSGRAFMTGFEYRF